MNAAFLQKYLPHIVFGLTVVYFGYQAYPQRDRADDFHYRDYGRLPVYDGGRYKPMDTVARSTLMVITNRQRYADYDTGRFFPPSYPATKWLLEVQTSPGGGPQAPLAQLFPRGAMANPAWDHKVFRIENDALLQMLDLKMRDGLRYSFNEIVINNQRNFTVFLREYQRVKATDPKQFTLLDSKVSELADHLQMMLRLSGHGSPLVIPNPDGSDQWKSFAEAFEQFETLPELPAGVDTEAYIFYSKLFVAYDEGNKAEFNRRLTERLKKLEAQGNMRKINLEIFFNEFAPFYHCLVMYVILAIMGALSWIRSPWSQPLERAAYVTMGLVFAVHLSGLILRMILQDRLFVFVTNLYSSAVFIGLGCAAFCLVVEYFYRNGIAIVVGSVTGFCTLIIAHILSLDGDTMVMMQAVLDTNFWLATHVTCITLGYTTAFVAGGMGITYIFLGLFTDMLRKEGSANLTKMTYGVLCAGMFLSFVGTVLGGLWADYSWGRFWGWDPKENGALLIVIWIALILHARWAGLIKHRGLAVLSVLGIIVTSWSWFGTNFLGVGLHAYGGAKGAAMAALVLFDLGILAIAGLGCLPLHMWQSFRPLSSLNKPPPPALPPKSSALSTGIKV
jgi:ABC-type transport system involved in cytochrome c biogenesis permease subunit